MVFNILAGNFSSVHTTVKTREARRVFCSLNFGFVAETTALTRIWEGSKHAVIGVLLSYDTEPILYGALGTLQKLQLYRAYSLFKKSLNSVEKTSTFPGTILVFIPRESY